VKEELGFPSVPRYYLKQEGRQIPLPLGHFSRALGYSDKTIVFDADPELPKSTRLYASDGRLACEYEVMRSTNFLGRVFPLEFRLTQHGSPANGLASPGGAKSVLLGKVKSIKVGKQPVLPEEVRKESEK